VDFISAISELSIISTLFHVSLGPHCAYFRMRTLKSQVAKVFTVRVEKTFALAV